MHYYQHHIGDFVRDTANLSDSQTVAYLRLIWMYYDTEEALPNSPKLLAFKLGSDPETIELLLESFFKKEGDSWRHKRIDAEILLYREKGEKARESANKRWNRSGGNADAMRSQCDGNTNAMPSQDFSSKVDANQEPITNNQEEEKEEDYFGDAAEAADTKKTSKLSLFKDCPAKEYQFAEKTFGMCREEVVALWEKFKAFHLNPDNKRDPSAWFFPWRSWVAEDAKRKAAAPKKPKKPEWDYDLHMLTGNGFKPEVKAGEEEFWKYVQ